MTVYFFLSYNAAYLVFGSMSDFAIRLSYTGVLDTKIDVHIFN